MKRILELVGASALLMWTGLGLVAWSGAAPRITVVLGDGSSRPEVDPALLVLSDDVEALRQDLRAVAEAMSAGLQALDQRLAAPSVPSAAREPAERGPLAGNAPETPGPESPALEPPPASESALGETVPGAAVEPRRSFLAFRLPSDDFRFDERRRWEVVPSLSRLGFDAKSTLHDFSGVASAVEGELTADLSRPDADPRVSLRVEARALETGNGDRDEAMREHLDAARHPALEFELTRFEPGAIDARARKTEGIAHGELRIRGVTREVSMPVRLSLDDACRLCVEGEMTLDLEHFGVPVPSKLGLISMDKDVKVWISLRLRASPRTED